MGAREGSDAAGFVDRVEAALATLAGPDWRRRRLLLAYSGGLDSTLLLHLLHELCPDGALTAVHVDHGLHPDAARWASHCREVAATLGIALIERRLALEPAPGDSVEAVAREARYAALAGIAVDGDIVLTAHHADDQLETVLLRLFRGTGVRGLAAIHPRARCGAALLLRPLLECSRAAIESEARRRGLVWLEDPSNADPRFDRNYLRQRCLPALLARWPSAGQAAGRLARHMGETERLLADLAAIDLGAAAASGPIPLLALHGQSPARVANAVRQALVDRGLPLPSAAQLGELLRILDARGDAMPLVRWPGVEARVYRRQLYLLAAPDAATAASAPAQAVPLHLAPGSRCTVGAGELCLVPAEDFGIPDRWARDGLDVVFRRGGERFRPQGHRRHQSLKHWFQEAAIVPWMRDRVPLVYRGDELIAVADLCLSNDLPTAPSDAPFWRPSWTRHPPLH